jgi:hypothetical protein
MRMRFGGAVVESGLGIVRDSLRSSGLSFLGPFDVEALLVREGGVIGPRLPADAVDVPLPGGARGGAKI